MLAIFFVVTPVTLGISLFSLFSLKTSASVKQALHRFQHLLIHRNPVLEFMRPCPFKLPSVSEQITASDARPEIVKQYLEYYDSPLAPFADLIVQTADKYSVDFRLITAIAQQESNFVKSFLLNHIIVGDGE